MQNFASFYRFNLCSVIFFSGKKWKFLRIFGIARQSQVTAFYFYIGLWLFGSVFFPSYVSIVMCVCEVEAVSFAVHYIKTTCP